MRLVCPNCEAKYEVPEDAIPDTGRDVQCANCGHAWFQMRQRPGGALPLTEPVSETPAHADVGPMDAGRPDAVTAAVDADAAPEMPSAAEAPPVEPATDEPILDAPDVKVPAPDAPISADPAPADDPPETELVEEAVPLSSGAEAAVPEAAVPEAEVAVAPEAEPFSEGMAEPAPEPADAVSHATEAALDAVTEPEPEADGTKGTEPPPVAEADPVAAAEAEGEAEGETAEPEVTEPAAAPAAAAAYAVDESVLAILREEAEREANARRSETLESQTDLGLDAAMPGRSGKSVKVAAKPAEVEPKPSARRDLLPDVEEINSTLRPSTAADGDDATPDFVAPPPQAPRGFRSGFLTLMTIAILAAALYIVAPRLGVLVPSLADPLKTYVSLVDSLRLGLDGMMRSATVAINGG